MPIAISPSYRRYTLALLLAISWRLGRTLLSTVVAVLLAAVFCFACARKLLAIW